MKKKTDKKQTNAAQPAKRRKARRDLTLDKIQVILKEISAERAKFRLLIENVGTLAEAQKSASLLRDSLRYSDDQIGKWKDIAAQLEMDKQRLIKQIVGMGNGSSANAGGNEAPGSPIDPGAAGVPDSEHPSA